MYTGIKTLGTGDKIFYGADGKQAYGEQKVNDKWYYFDKENNGIAAANEFIDLEGKRVYYGTDGSMRYGEQKIDGYWYYFDKITGKMQT